MNEILEQLSKIHQLVVAAWDAVETDPYTSNALKATVDEFMGKSQKALSGGRTRSGALGAFGRVGAGG